jgi:hypothetical protein
MALLLRQYGLPLVIAMAGSTCIMLAEMYPGSRGDYVTLYGAGVALDAAAVAIFIHQNCD